MITPRSQNMNLHSSLAASDWPQKWDLPINAAKCNHFTIGLDVPFRFSFSPDGSGTPIPYSKLVKDEGGSPSAQCTEAANKARHLISLIRRSLQDLSKSNFTPLSEAFLRPPLEYVVPSCSPNLVADINHLERTEILAARLVIAIRHLPYVEKL